MIKQQKHRSLLKIVAVMVSTALICERADSATHYECYDSRFDAITLNFVVDGNEVYAAPRNKFNPNNDFNKASEYWTHLGNGQFKHKLMNGTTRCKQTNKKFNKPKLATADEAIKLCNKAIKEDHKSLNPKMPRSDKYELLTTGEFKQSKYNKQYGNVVVEVERKGWFLGGLYLAVCQVDLTNRTAFVNVFDDVSDTSNIYYGISDWYSVKNTNLIEPR